MYTCNSSSSSSSSNDKIMNLKTSKLIEEDKEANPNSRNMKEHATYPGRNCRALLFCNATKSPKPIVDKVINV